MNLIKAVEDMNKHIAELEDRSSQLGQQSWELRQQRDKLIAQLILEENLLSGSIWDVELGHFVSSSGTYLRYTGKLKKGSPMDKVVDLSRSDYHSDFQLTEDVTIRFDDNDITLIFKEGKTMLPFVQKYGLSINGTSIQGKLAKLKKDVAALELVCHQLKL